MSMQFIKKHKKFVIIFSILLVFITTLVVLMFTLFNLKKIDINFKTETKNLNIQIQNEIKQTTLNYGGSVLFINKDKIIDELEKKFPYIKVVNIETVFPDKFVLHCVEREELFVIKSGNKYYILDEELKILRIEENYNSISGQPILLKYQDIKLNDSENPPQLEIINLDLNLQNAEVGQFLNISSSTETGEYFTNKLQKISTTILNSFEKNNRDISYLRAKYKTFEIFYKPEVISDESIAWRVCLRLKDYSNYICEIYDADDKLSKKLSVMDLALSDALLNDPSKLENSKLIIFENIYAEIAYLFEKIN